MRPVFDGEMRKQRAADGEGNGFEVKPIDDYRKNEWFWVVGSGKDDRRNPWDKNLEDIMFYL